jgi:hypothetical protein
MKETKDQRPWNEQAKDIIDQYETGLCLETEALQHIIDVCADVLFDLEAMEEGPENV